MVSEFYDFMVWLQIESRPGWRGHVPFRTRARLCVLHRHLWTEAILRQTKHEWNKERRAQKLHEDVKGRGFWVRRRTRTHQRKVWHRNRTQETKIGRAIAARCSWPAAGVFVCVRADRGAWLINYLQQVRFGLPAALQSLLRFGRTSFSVCWWVCSLIAQPIRSPESQSGDHPRAGESVITHTCGLLTAWAASFFILLFVGWLVSGCLFVFYWFVCLWLSVAWEQTSVITSSETPSALVLFSGNMRF